MRNDLPDGDEFRAQTLMRLSRRGTLLYLLLAGSTAHAASVSFTADRHTLRCDAAGVLPAAWSGACKNGLADGPGAVEWTQANGKRVRIEGTLAAGAIVGNAELVSGSNQYSGTFKDFSPDGEGFFRYANGRIYEGGMADANPNGHGVLLESDRSRYDGEWVAGKREGHGSATFALGGSYDGQWRNNRFDGQGTIVYAGSGRTHTLPAAVQVKNYEYRDTVHGVRSLLPEKIADATLPGVPWDDMNEGERVAFRQQYAALEAGDEPPYPAQGMRQVAVLVKKVHDAFPDYRGRVQVLVMVGPDGKAESVTTVGKVPADVNLYVASILNITPYKPAVCHGAPCRMNFSIVFALD
jgi:hypothetical protein